MERRGGWNTGSRIGRLDLVPEVVVKTLPAVGLSVAMRYDQDKQGFASAAILCALVMNLSMSLLSHIVPSSRIEFERPCPLSSVQWTRATQHVPTSPHKKII